MIRLKELRTEKNLSQRDIAEYLGITQQAYANYERNAREPDFGTISKIADLFDVSVDYLLGRTDDINQKSGEENITFDDFTYAMYNESKELTDEDKQALLGMARLLKKKKESQNG